MPNCDKRMRGFTLAEAMMATVILGVAAAGVLLPFTSGARVQAEGVRRTLAAKLANNLLEQIISTEFDDILSKYDTYTEQEDHIIRDFDTETEFTDPMYNNFSRGALCAYDESQDFFIVVTVWVKYRGREITSINRLIAK